MERIMEVMAVLQNSRVTLATFFLIRNARHWWDSVKRRYRDPLAITWQVFRAAFDSQYYPQAYQNLKMQEVLQLEQGMMTVLEYEKKFHDLSKYCLPLVEDESKKCQLFTMGLKASIRDIVISQWLTNFSEVVMSASLIESSQMTARPRGELRRQQFEIGGPSQGSSKRGNYSSGSSSGRSYGGYRPGFNSSGGSNQSSSSGTRSGGSAVRGAGRQLLSGSGRRSRPQCARCGRYHSGPCQQGTTGCYYCGQPGHFRKDCPLFLQTRETTAASTPETVMQGRSQEIPQFVEASSSGGAQTSVASRGSSQPRGRGGSSRATGRVYNMSQ
ncbi:uncharacterized protein LOC109948648 [Prunus persica]|uniref:uncharacterized protein LOC109948648 n=1 Tax=Prunus persica TaxID=3760 RepID=UPI0009AB5582|nr:uncharacterized protein LOC109948648 [Prunus persica]